MAKIAKNKRRSPKTKGSTLLFRVDHTELQVIHTKAFYYHKGNVSNYLREAALNYKPLKKVAR